MSANWLNSLLHPNSVVPPFRVYYPSVEEMDREQVRFYRYLATELRHGRHPDVDGSISYLFCFVYDVLARGQGSGFGDVHSQLLGLAEAYHHEAIFSEYCLHWSYDCLLAQGLYEEYLEHTEPDDLQRRSFDSTTARLNVQLRLGLQAASVDLHRLGRSRITSVTRRSPGIYREILEEVFRENEAERGDWFSRLLQSESDRGQWHKTLFNGAAIKQPPLGVPYWHFIPSGPLEAELQACSRIAEETLRERLGLPSIGEGWVSETALFRAIEKAFPETAVIHHGQPSWLGRQHFDIWLPRWKIAIEYHGKQHFEPVDFFGGEESLTATMERDERKRVLAEKHGTVLLVVTEKDMHSEVIERVRRVREDWRINRSNLRLRAS